ncbi:hypothetical protein SEUCBS139899_004981 [Sporothrix eucalyptigena]|uniref:Uncharacterized protein n=1 Tax=Sporothrix eucalyptigena TaxID=1812306 RepID=A0ABP0AKZ7_9PEZI
MERQDVEVINWATLEIDERIFPGLVIPQLAVRKRWKTDMVMRQTYSGFDRAMADSLERLAFTFTNLDALTKALNERSCFTPGNDKYHFQSAVQYFQWAFTTEPYPIHRRRIETLQN